MNYLAIARTLARMTGTELAEVAGVTPQADNHCPVLVTVPELVLEILLTFQRFLNF